MKYSKFKFVSVVSLILVSCSNLNIKSASIQGNTSTVVNNSSTQQNTFTITWKNWDGTILKQDKNVEAGVIPFYEGNIPTRNDDDEAVYIWEGEWSRPLDPIYSDTVFIARFTRKVKKYLTTNNIRSYLRFVDTYTPTDLREVEWGRRGFQLLKVSISTRAINESSKFYNVSYSVSITISTWYTEPNGKRYYLNGSTYTFNDLSIDESGYSMHSDLEMFLGFTEGYTIDEAKFISVSGYTY